jgi:hypothetical protein
MIEIICATSATGEGAMRRETNIGLRLVLMAWLALPLAGAAASGPAKVDVRFGKPEQFAENRGKATSASSSKPG